MKHCSFILILTFSFLLPSCKERTEENVIYTSFYPIYDFTKRIVGDKFEVKNITPYGMEPHDFEPTAKQVSGMIDGKCLLLNGIGMDAWAENMPEELSMKSYKVTSGIEIKTIDGIQDPHVWLSLDNAMTELRNILGIVQELDSSNKSYYQDNYEKEILAFCDLEAKYKDSLSSLSQRHIVVSHAAFGYLCEEFSLEQIYVSGLSDEDEPSAKAVEKIIEDIQKYSITTMFYEESESSDVSKQIADATGVKMETLHTLEGLSKEEEETEDYLSLMEDNLKKIVEANKA